MTYPRHCGTCETWIWSATARHVCPPIWLCGILGEEPDCEVYATDAAEAAEKFAKSHNEDGDYPLMRGRGNYVDVLVTRTGVEPSRFRVTAEPSIDYHASELDAA